MFYFEFKRFLRILFTKNKQKEGRYRNKLLLLLPSGPDRLNNLPTYLPSIFYLILAPGLPSVAMSPKGESEGWWRERDSNPRYPLRGIQDFQSCAFNHSAISPTKIN